MSNEQAPECCPFCGAKMHGSRSQDGEFARYKCGNAFDARNASTREMQSSSCAEAERERLTRERDDWKRCAEELNAFMERARSKTHHSREGLLCLRQFDALKAKEAKP